MLKKVSKVGGSKPTQTKTITKKSSGSSKQTQVKTTTKSSGSSKVSNINTVKQTTPAPKPKNVDKVEFGKPKPTVDTGVYHKPKLIAAATGRDPEPKQVEHKKKVHEQAQKEVNAEKFVKSGTGKFISTVIDGIVLFGESKIPIKHVDTAAPIVTEAHNVAQAQEGKMTIGEKVVYNFLSQPAPQPGNQITTGMPSDEQKFVVQNRNEIDAEKEKIKKEEEETKKSGET